MIGVLMLRAITAVTIRAAATPTLVWLCRTQRQARWTNGSAIGLDRLVGQVAPDLLGQVGGQLVALGFLLAQGLQAGGLQARGDLRDDLRGGVGGSLITLRMISEVFGATNGGRPVRIS